MEAHDQSCSIASGPELRGTRLRDSKQVRRLKISQGCSVRSSTSQRFLRIGSDRITSPEEGSVRMVESGHCLTQGSQQLLDRGVWLQGWHDRLRLQQV